MAPKKWSEWENLVLYRLDSLKEKIDKIDEKTEKLEHKIFFYAGGMVVLGIIAKHLLDKM